MKLKTLISLLLIFSLIFGLCCCAGAPGADETTADAEPVSASETAADDTETEDPADGAFVFTAENYTRMGGSLANKPLGQAVTAAVLGITREDADAMISFTGSTTDNYKQLADGDFDILLAYEPSEEAKAYIEEKNVPLEMTPIGVDALVFICSTENPLDSLTLDQIKDVYTGRTTDWADLGSDAGEIIAYQRNPDSGSQTLFDKLVNLGDELMDPPEGLRIVTMIGLLEAVADYDNSENALGYTVYYYLTNMEKEKLDTAKILAVDGAAPSNETIGSGAYPLTNDFYVVIRASAPQNSPERILYNWICSAQGRALVLQENYPVRTE